MSENSTTHPEPEFVRSWASIGQIRSMRGVGRGRARRSVNMEKWSTRRKWWRRG